MMKVGWGSLLSIFQFFLLGCSQPPPSLSGGYLFPQARPPSTIVSRRVLLVADNQVHNVYGAPVPILRSAVADQIVQSAIRPIHLDFYGQDLLAWLVADQGVRLPIVHLGDACDFSCSGEFIRFWEIIRQARKGWVMAPGNHDGYFFGNAQRAVHQEDWPAACRNAGQPMNKALFVKLYLAAITLQDGPGFRALADYLGLPTDVQGPVDLLQRAASIRHHGAWQYAADVGDGHPFLHAVSWRVNAENPWKSFVVQAINLTRHPASTANPEPVGIILLDTAHYQQQPALLPLDRNAGVTGEMRPEQLAQLQPWIMSSEANKVWLLAGHHPFDRLTPDTRQYLSDLRKRLKAPLYLSAHTHAGQFLTHGGGKGEATWIELNIGSILDWSLEFRTLSLSRVKDDGRLLIRSPRNSLYTWLQEEGLPARDQTWEAKPDDPDYYLSYRDLKELSAVTTEDRLKNALLAAYLRLLQFIPTRNDVPPEAAVWPQCCKNDVAIRQEITRLIALPESRLQEKTDFLVELDRFERHRQVQDPQLHQRFRLSQALWSSKYDTARARRPLVDDLFIIFPKE